MYGSILALHSRAHLDHHRTRPRSDCLTPSPPRGSPTSGRTTPWCRACPVALYFRWALPSVGEPFWGAWKAHCMDLVRQRQEDARAGVARRGRPKRKPEGPALPRPGTQRKREGAAPPPSHSQQARLERLAKARRLLDAQGGSSSTPSTSSASPTGGPPSPGGRPGASPPRSPHLTMVEVPGHSLLAAHYGTSAPQQKGVPIEEDTFCVMVCADKIRLIGGYIMVCGAPTGGGFFKMGFL